MNGGYKHKAHAQRTPFVLLKDKGGRLNIGKLFSKHLGIFFGNWAYMYWTKIAHVLSQRTLYNRI